MKKKCYLNTSYVIAKVKERLCLKSDKISTMNAYSTAWMLQLEIVLGAAGILCKIQPSSQRLYSKL